MGLWSRIKKAAKKVYRAVKAVVRVVVRIVVEIVMRVINIFDLLLGFLTWPQKKLTLYVLVLSPLGPAERKAAIVNIDKSIDEARRILKDRFNVKLRPYSSQYVEFFEGEAPTEALNPSCCGADLFGEEFTTSGEFYARHLAGWVGIPTSLRFPVTVFIVDDVKCKMGCSNGVAADYVVEELDGLERLGEPFPYSLMMHEMGHACGLLHSSDTSNIMLGGSERGDGAKGFQKNILRSSRHVTYW